MRAWGWTKEDLWCGARMAARRIGEFTELELREVSEGGIRVKYVNFLLRFESSTKRMTKARRHALETEATYPPGVMVRPSYKSRRVLDALPLSELGLDRFKYRQEQVRFQRSCGAPCWHAFGHFFRCLFEINPEGKVKTGLAVYRGAKGFEDAYRSTNIEKGSVMEPLQYSEACDCYHYGVDSF